MATLPRNEGLVVVGPWQDEPFRHRMIYAVLKAPVPRGRNARVLLWNWTPTGGLCRGGSPSMVPWRDLENAAVAHRQGHETTNGLAQTAIALCESMGDS